MVETCHLPKCILKIYRSNYIKLYLILYCLQIVYTLLEAFFIERKINICYVVFNLQFVKEKSENSTSENSILSQENLMKVYYVNRLESIN